MVDILYFTSWHRHSKKAIRVEGGQSIKKHPAKLLTALQGAGNQLFEQTGGLLHGCHDFDLLRAAGFACGALDAV